MSSLIFLIGKVPLYAVEDIVFDRRCQSLIGKVQHGTSIAAPMCCTMCQSLIGKVQQQHLRHLLLPLSLKPTIFAMFFEKSRSISIFQSPIFTHFKPFLENRDLGAEIDRLFILICPLTILADPIKLTIYCNSIEPA